MKKFIILILGLFTFMSHAHQLSTAYLTAELNESGLIQGDIQLRGFDLNQALNLDSDMNGQLTWAEIESQSVQLNQYIQTHLLIKRNNQVCPLIIEPQLKAERHFNQGYLVAVISAQCAVSGSIEVTYTGLFAEDYEHKLLFNLTGQTEVVARVISAENHRVHIDLNHTSLMTTFNQYAYQGILHIWKGLDHILFLLVLLLGCVLVRQNGQWQVRENAKQIIISTAWIVTAFTLAHSITLTSTAMGWVVLNSRWVELGIALSVLFAALNNIWPWVVRLSGLTFIFGLLHGMGFAGVLVELGLPTEQKIWAVLAFNLGVEIGQLVILAIVLPLLISIRWFSWYQTYFLRFSSVAIAMVAIGWTIERF